MSSRSPLQNLYLFKNMSPQEIETVSSASQSQPFNSGETVFVRDEAAKALYFIKSGTIKIQQSTKSGDNLDIATLSAGSHFGEMAFVDGEIRSATATAMEPCELIVLPYEKLNVLLDKNPGVAVKFYRAMAHFLCGRLRATTNDLSYSKEKNVSHF